MNDVKLLNLDELAVVKRVVLLGGKEYRVAEQTVGQMATRLQLTKHLDTSKAEDFIEMMRLTAQNILPDAPEEVISNMTSEQITRLIQFINDQELNEAAERMAEEADEAGEGAPADSEKK